MIDFTDRWPSSPEPVADSGGLCAGPGPPRRRGGGQRLGCSMGGEGADSGVADDVVDEITKAGGKAVASYDSVDSPAAAKRSSTPPWTLSGGWTRSSATREYSAVCRSKTSRPTRGPECCACISTAAFSWLSPRIA